MKLSRICLGLSCAALLLLILSGPILRLGLVHFRFALLLFAGALLLALLGSLLSLVALAIPRLRGDRVRPLSTALVLGLLVMVGPAIFVQKASGVPAIHDISTDTVNPPAFVDVIPIRQAAGADNPPEYPGASVAAQQKAAYPDIAPRDLTVPPDQAFARAVTAARGMGWEIVAEKAAEGRIEATATTPWFGFKDDIVIRVVATSGGARVDVRSKSRVGRSDVGANAARIRGFMNALS